MAAKPLDPAVADAIVTDWRMGRLSIRDIADKHDVSHGKVGQLCKGVERDLLPIVDKGTQYKTELSAHDGRIVDAVQKEVDERTKHIQFFTHAALRNVQSAVKKITETTSQAEHRMLADTILKGKETVLGKEPDTAIQINNGQPDRITRIEEVIVDPANPDASRVPASTEASTV